MTLKQRLSIYISAAFSILFGIGITIVYLSFASFRKEEFSDRLEEKALTTVELLLNVKEIDEQMLKVIDQNSINKLYKEKTLVFDKNYQLIYSSINDASIQWDKQDLVNLKKTNRFFRSEVDKEILGIFYYFQEADYYVLIAAEDRYGKSKLQYLFYSLLIMFVVGSTLVWISAYYIIRHLTRPLDAFQEKIMHISANELNTQLPVNPRQNDEITLLTRTFNQMLARIEKSFAAQREFTANASHELRTPISRITFQLDNLLQSQDHPPATRQYLTRISDNVSQLTELINSLLLLAKNSGSDTEIHFKTERVDEILFLAFEQVRRSHRDFKMNFEIVESEHIPNDLEIKAAKSVLEIALANLLRNAYQYSFDHTASVVLEHRSADTLTLSISSEGTSLTQSEQSNLFQPFTRGANARHTNGSGLGLRIVKRILDHHGASIRYSTHSPSTHCFEIVFTI